MLNITFSCGYCDKQHTVSSHEENVIREDLETEILEAGWWSVRNVFWDRLFCSQQCLQDDLCL